MKMNAMNQVPKGEKLFEEGMASDGIFVVLKGKGRLVNTNVSIPVASGDFLGIWDLYAGSYNTSCIATEEMTVYALPVKSSADLQPILEGNKEYGGRITAAFAGIFIARFPIAVRWSAERKPPSVPLLPLCLI